MSIINSIVTGKGRGKVGNAVLVTLKGQSIMKSLNTSPANPKTPLQTASRGKMANAVKAWQFLFIFLANITALRKSTESNYNAFVRLSKNMFGAVVQASGSESAGQLSELSLGSGNFVTATGCAFGSASTEISFSTGGLPFVAGSYAKAITWMDPTGENHIVSKLITEAEWNAGLCNILGVVESLSFFGSYIYNPSTSKCSNISFHNL